MATLSSIITPSNVTTATNTQTLTNKTITGGILNGTLGATTPSTVAATTITATGAITSTVANNVLTLRSSVGNATNKISFGTASGEWSLINYSDTTGYMSIGQPAGRSYGVNIQTNGANVGVFTATGLAVTGALSATGQLSGQGTTTNDSAAAGYIGEHVTANLGRNVTSLTSGVATNVTSISLTAGDWDVNGMIEYSVQGGTEAVSAVLNSISTTSGTMATQATAGYAEWRSPLNPIGDISFNVGPVRISIASTTTVYLVGAITWTGGTGINVGGTIRARRIR